MNLSIVDTNLQFNAGCVYIILFPPYLNHSAFVVSFSCMSAFQTVTGIIAFCWNMNFFII